MNNLLEDPNKYKMLEKLHLLLNEEIPEYNKGKLYSLFHSFNETCKQLDCIKDYKFFKYILETIRVDFTDKLISYCHSHDLTYNIYYNGKAFINKKINNINLKFIESIRQELIEIKNNDYFITMETDKVNMLIKNDFIVIKDKKYTFTNKSFALIKNK